MQQKKIIIFSLIYFIVYSVQAQIGKPDLSKFEYQVKEINYARQDEPPAGCAYVKLPSPIIKVEKNSTQVFEETLNSWANDGWIVTQILDWKISTYIPKMQFSSDDNPHCSFTVLHCVVVCSRLKFNPETDLQKTIEQYSKHYADSISTVLINHIDSLTWSQMGAQYRNDLSKDIIQKLNQLLEANKNEIIEKLQQQSSH